MEKDSEESDLVVQKTENNDSEDGERPDSQNSMMNSEYGTPVKEQCTIENSLYGKYNMQEQEIERLEAQNAEYREKLLKTIRERDLNDELLKNMRGQHKKEVDGHVRRIRDLEVQLKATQDKATAQESHFNVTTREMSSKYNTSVQQLTKKVDQNEKEKNEAVVKYAMREGEMMKLRDEIKNKENSLKVCKEELESNQKSQSQEHVEELEKMVNNAKVELEKVKHERFDLENRLKIAEKKVETLTSNLGEMKQQCDVLRKQLIQAKDEKSHAQQIEHDRRENDLERKLKETESILEKLRASQLDMATKFEESSRENIDLLSKIDILQDQMSLEEDRRKLCEEQIDRLRGVESFVVSSSHQVEESQKEKQSADEERKQAEEEAIECREHAERMLKLNQQLTERNAEIQREVMELKMENSKLKEELEGVKEENERVKLDCRRVEAEIDELKEEMLKMKVEESMRNTSTTEGNDQEEEIRRVEEEKDQYKSKYEECLKKLEHGESRFIEVKNNFEAYKKKSHANIKELRSELSTVRKLNTSASTSLDPGNHTTNASSDSVPSMSSRSRASSITSMDRVTSVSREEENTTIEESKKLEQQQTMQQVMIDKIVLLQRKLARRTEKIEFLEEHVRQCLEELQKKTKIIQHFALREEASLLMPTEGSLEKVPIVKKGSTYALMGAMFTSSGGEKKQSQILSEVNSRLQAVLEDVIQKNISMRASVDTLGSENTRLVRENRLLTLSQARMQDIEDNSDRGS